MCDDADTLPAIKINDLIDDESEIDVVIKNAIWKARTAAMTGKVDGKV